MHFERAIIIRGHDVICYHKGSCEDITVAPESWLPQAPPSPLIFSASFKKRGDICQVPANETPAETLLDEASQEILDLSDSKEQQHSFRLSLFFVFSLPGVHRGCLEVQHYNNEDKHHVPNLLEE